MCVYMEQIVKHKYFIFIDINYFKVVFRMKLRTKFHINSNKTSNFNDCNVPVTFLKI